MNAWRKQQLYGLDASELPRRTGSIDQVARIDRFIDDDGAARGARRLRLVTGGGLEAEVLPDRALDLGHVTYRGTPVAWCSPTGHSAPGLAESRGTQWLRSFAGGLLSTCGLDTFGPPSTTQAGEYPMHGRVGTIPATVKQAEVVDGELLVRGEVRQSAVFGENLVLRRTLRADLGGSSLSLEDTVTNESFRESGHMVLYHANFGWPLLSEGATLDIASSKVAPRDDDAAAGVARWHEIEPPQEDFPEQVFLHDVRSTARAHAVIDNPTVDLRVSLSFDTSTLPALHQWKMTGTGHYVMGLEPANTGHIQGRAAAEEQGALPLLAPGATVTYRLTFDFGPSHQEHAND